MSVETQRALAEYKAQIDAKYAAMKGRTLKDATAGSREAAKQRRRKDNWLLINPQGEIDGAAVRWAHPSATEAFELFFPRKRERMQRAAQGWHIEEDDENGSRFDAYCESLKREGASV